MTMTLNGKVTKGLSCLNCDRTVLISVTHDDLRAILRGETPPHVTLDDVDLIRRTLCPGCYTEVNASVGLGTSVAKPLRLTVEETRLLLTLIDIGSGMSWSPSRKLGVARLRDLIVRQTGVTRR